MRKVSSGGGWAAIKYSLRLANKVGWRAFWKSMRSKNACKTCALGMGGQKGGMVNEAGAFPEVCKKSFQAMASDMQGAITADFFSKYSLANLKELTPRELENCGRLAFPVYAGPGDTHYRRISWDLAMQKLAGHLQVAGPRQSFFYASGRSSNEAGFLLQLFARLFGTNYVNNCSYYCHQASGVALSQSLGSGTATVDLDDLEHADFVMLIGGNPASNHPRMMRSLMKIRRGGGEVVVINPIRELGLVNFRVPSDVRSLFFGSSISSQYLQPHIGGDIALLLGMAKVILEKEAHNIAFIESATEGFALFKDKVERTTWYQIQNDSGVKEDEIRSAAEKYMKAKKAIFAWTMGITHHLHGVDNVRMIVNLALLRGMAGKPGAGLMPIRGHSNVQGMGTIGVTPALKTGMVERMVKRLGVQPPSQPGLDTMACMHATDRGEMKVAFNLGGNLFGSNPDSNSAVRTFQKLDLACYLNTTLNTTHTFGLGKETLILPVLARDEEPQPTTQESMFSYIRMSEGGKSRVPEARSEVSIMVDLGKRIFGTSGPVNWTDLESHAKVRELMADLVPGLEQLKEMNQTKREFTIPGRIIHQAQFPTISGKAVFHPTNIPYLQLPAKHLRLMTIRSEGQFNTVVYDEEDLYRGQERRDVILMAEEDIRRLGLKTDQKVTVSSSAGRMEGILVRCFDIKPGNAAMYCPEANVLIPRDVDPQSKTPAFKSILVKIEAMTEQVTAPVQRMLTVKGR